MFNELLFTLNMFKQKNRPWKKLPFDDFTSRSPIEVQIRKRISP